MTDLIRNPDGTIDVPEEIKQAASYLRCACPEQKTLIEHLDRVANEAERNHRIREYKEMTHGA